MAQEAKTSTMQAEPPTITVDPHPTLRALRATHAVNDVVPFRLEEEELVFRVIGPAHIRHLVTRIPVPGHDQEAHGVLDLGQLLQAFNALPSPTQPVTIELGDDIVKLSNDACIIKNDQSDLLRPNEPNEHLSYTCDLTFGGLAEDLFIALDSVSAYDTSCRFDATPSHLSISDERQDRIQVNLPGYDPEDIAKDVKAATVHFSADLLHGFLKHVSDQDIVTLGLCTDNPVQAWVRDPHDAYTLHYTQAPRLIHN